LFFLFSPNAFACFVSRRDLMIVSLAEAQSPQRISMFCSYPKHLCVLCALARVNIDGFFYIANSGFTDKRS
jgi:hypothetical protein